MVAFKATTDADYRQGYCCRGASCRSLLYTGNAVLLLIRIWVYPSSVKSFLELRMQSEVA